MCKFVQLLSILLILLYLNIGYLECSPIDFLLSDYYDDDDENGADDISNIIKHPEQAAKLGYDVLVDQRQKGSDNYRIHISDILIGLPSSGTTNALGSIAADYLFEMPGSLINNDTPDDDADDDDDDIVAEEVNDVNVANDTNTNGADAPYVVGDHKDEIMENNSNVIDNKKPIENVKQVPLPDKEIPLSNVKDLNVPATSAIILSPAAITQERRRQTSPKFRTSNNNKYKSRLANFLQTMLKQRNH